MLKNTWRFRVWALSCLVTAGLRSVAQDPTSICQTMASQAARNIHLAQGSSSFSNAAFSSYCYQDGRFNSSNSGFGLNVVIPYLDVPLGVSYSGSNASQFMTAWCQQNKSLASGAASALDLSSTIDKGYYGGVNGCVAAVQNGSYIQPVFTADPKTMTIQFHVGNTEFTNLGLVASDRVSCVNPSDKTVVGTLEPLRRNSGDFIITCTRTPQSVPAQPAVQHFDDATITVSAFPSGITIAWPHDEVSAYGDAQIVKGMIGTLTGQIAALRETNAALSDRVILARNVLLNGEFIIHNGNGCPTYYQKVNTLLMAHDFPRQNQTPDPADPANQAGFMVNNTVVLANDGWSVIHPVLCRLTDDAKQKLSTQ